MAPDGAPAPSAKKGPSLQEQLQSGINLAASAAVASSKPGFTPVPKEEANKALYGKANVQTGTLRGVPGETDSTVKNLNEKYKNLGVQFEKAPSKIQKAVGLGDIVVTADDGSTHIVQSTGSDEKLREEEAKLQSFLMGKSAGVEKKPVTPMEFLMMSRDGISPQEEGKFKRVYSQEMVDNSIKFANDELNNTKKAVDDINKEVAQLNEEAKKISEIVAVSGVTPDIEETYNSITQRYQDLQARADERVKYAKSIGALADEGVKKAVGENTRLLSYNGNIPSALYNSLLKGAKDLVGGAMAALPEVADIATLGASESFYGDKAKAKEDSKKFLDEIYDNLKADGVSKEYTTEGNMAWKSLFSVPEFIPSLLVPGGAAARVTAMTTQGIGRRFEEMNSNPETKNLPEEEKFFMAAGPALVEAKLENFGLTQWLGANKGLASSIFINALSKVAPKAGVKGLNKIINAEISNLALRGAANTAGAMISEFETGALQNISDTAFRDAYEIAKGKDLFKQPGFGDKDFGKALLEDAMLEGLGGMWMAGAVNIAQQTSNYVTGKSNTNETFRLVKQILADETTSKSLVATLKSQIMDGKLSKEQAVNTINNFNEARAIAMELPQDLSEDNQRKAFDLIAEKRKLEKQIEGKDPSLVDKQKTRITAIDQELKNISNAVQEQTTSEVPVQPGAAVSGEVAQGEPQAEPQVVTEEGQAKEEVTQYIADLQETKQSDPEQYWSVDSVTEEAAKEGTVISDEDGGVVVSKEGDIKGLFKKAGSKAKGVAQKLLQKAIVAGGIKLDNFDNYLTPIYEKAGFRVVSRVPFNEEYAPEGWNKEKHGTPDVVAMVYDPQNKLDIQEQKFDDYDQAMAYRDQFIPQVQQQLEFDQAVNNSAQSLKMVAPDLKIIVAENTEDAQLQIAEALSAVAPTQATDVAEGFTTETRGQTVFVNGKPFAIVLDKSQADSKTVGHEAWELMLNDAFGDDQAKFKEFRDEIDRQLRLNGYGEIADALTKFSNQKGYEDVKYSEYMAELGGMLVADGFKKGSLDAKQKSLLQKIGDVINKFARLFTGKKQFLDEATPEDILGFMITISNKVAKGEDISQFFRQEPGTIIDRGDIVIDTRASKKQKFENNKYETKQPVYNPKGGLATVFTFIADRMGTGEWTGLNPESGIKVPLMGGIGYPMLKKLYKKAGWAVDGGSVMSSFLNKIVKSKTGIGVPVIMSEYSHVSNLTFAKIFEAEMGWMVKSGETTAKEQLDNINKYIADSLIAKKDLSPKLKKNEKTGLMEDKNANAPLRVFTTEKNGTYTPKTYKSMDEVYKELEATFGARALFMQNMIGIGVKNRYAKIEKYNLPDMIRVADETADSRLKGVPSGSAVSAIQFDQEKAKKFVADIGSNKDLKKYHSASSVGVDPHISYEYVVEGESLGWLPGVVDLAEAEGVDEDTKAWYDDQRAKYKEGKISEAQLRSNVTAKARASMPEVVIKTKSQKAFEESIQKEEDNVKLKYSESGKLLAPNGKPSNLPEYLARYTRTSVFKDWFGDWENDPKNSSKAVDQNGEPALVYHGSPFGGITKFDRKESAKATSGLKEFGTYFTTNRKVAEIYASEGKISQEKITEINQQINKLEQARDNTRSSSEYYNLEKEIEALKKNKSPKVYAAFLNLRSIKDFDAESKAFPEAWRNLKVDAGYKTATDRDAMDFLKGGKFGVKKVDGVKASNIIDLATGAPKREAIDFVGDVYLVFDDVNDAIRVVEPQTVTTRSQKSVPAVVDEVLTDDGKGNYVFVHYSDELRDTIKPMSGSKKNFTSREEVSAISAVGGVAMYYTKQGQVESGVGNVPHTVLVPKDKVYFYGSTEKGTVSHDPEGFEEEARQRFQAYRNRGNEDRPTKYAFDANNSAAWVTKVAAENGYDMLVTNWGGPKSYRAQTTKALKPEAEYTGFKQIPEPTYEVGDEIFLYGRYATVVAVDGNTLSYEAPNDFGRFDSGKFTLSPYTSNKIMLIEKAKPTVTTKSQKVVVNTISGYERMMGEVEGILDKTMNRTGSYNQATANAVGYIQKSSVYERADDSQREQIIRDFVKLRGEKIKVAPSVGKILGQIKDTKKVTVNEKTALKDQIKLEAKAAKDAVAFVKQLRMQISGRLKMMAGRGVISAKQASAILARYDRMNILNPDMRDRFVDYMANVFQSAEYADKVKEATKLRKTIRKAAKNPDNQAESSKLAKTFAEIDPSRVENIDDYLNNAEQILKSVSRKTGDVKMRSLVNMTDMVSYIDKEIQEQRKQIKNEILSKYQDLVDAGVLDSKMTINEINKVVAAIEEKKDESVAKAKEAKAAVKQMMDEVSPILLQIARTGEDPFTGDPIDLTQDEKAAIVKLAKMDLDNLSLAEAVKALEYANNFIANGVTSGIVGMVDLYEGSLNAEKLAKKGFKSIPFKKYFSKGAGRIWAEQIASLPMLNKLMWGSTSRALEVSEASGVTGVSNGKAKAIKIVEKAVKEYVATFSKVKGFLSSENVVERGMFAFVSRTVIGDEFQAQDEFNRRKSLIEETIQALKDPENSTDAEIKKGEVVEKVYNKILKDAKNVREVRVNVSDINQSAVDWWVNEWSKHYDRMDEVSRNVYNTLLSRDANFTPDRFQLKEVSPAAEEDFDSGFFGNFENVSTEKSGSLKENKRIKNLPQNKNGVKTRIVNLDFDVNNVNALTNAMVDVETAGSVMQMKGFVTSKDFSKLFASKEDKNVYKKRLVSYVNRAKGQGYVDQSELKTLNRLVNTVASFGTAKALFSLSQPFKQSIPPLFNTLVQTGRLDLGTLMVGGFSFIDRTGYPIANRGISSQGELKSINRQLVEAEKNLLLRGVDGVAAYSNLMLELTLKYPDIMTARSSWLSFYKKGLKKEGIKTSGINWNTHEVNKKAADYAQMMVDSQQNISDSDMQGEFMASKDPAKAFLRRAIFPLMTFVLNQKTRIWADVRTLSNKAVTTAEDRQEAALSLAGALVELGAFSAISYAANSMLWEVAMNILEAVSGEDDDDDREEEKKKMILRRSAYTAQNFMKDFFVPPIPGADLLASKGINYILDETNLSSEIPADWFGIEDDRVKFRLYDKENQGYLDMLGTQGIALEKALELADYYDMAIDGTFKEESYGTKREKQILEGDADMARINAAIMTGYYGGLLPADVAYIVGQINKKIKKRAEVVEEED
jgi:hypothetical protein